MKQYLLSVHMVEGQQQSPEATERAYRDVDALNAELVSGGAWVFAGGLHPPATATVVRISGGEVLTTDGPFAETKEHLGGFWVIQAPDLDAALAWAAKATRACAQPVEVRPFQENLGAWRMPLRPGEIDVCFRREYGRCVAILTRFGGIDIAEEAVQEAFTVAVDQWPLTGMPPNPGEWITTTARNRAIDHLRREASRPGQVTVGSCADQRGPGAGAHMPAAEPAWSLSGPGRHRRRAQRRADRGADRLAPDPGAVQPADDAGSDVRGGAEPVALAEVDGPEAALASIAGLGLGSYHPFHATRADLLRRLGRRDGALGAYDAAISRTANDAERHFLTRRRQALASSTCGPSPAAT